MLSWCPKHIIVLHIMKHQWKGKQASGMSWLCSASWSTWLYVVQKARLITHTFSFLGVDNASSNYRQMAAMSCHSRLVAW
jgi:hypothetical protein